MITLSMYAATDIGKQRRINQDCVQTVPERGFALLADGMGGYKAGEVASAMAIQIIADELQQKLDKIPKSHVDQATGLSGEAILLRNSIHQANDAIYHAAKTKASYAGMGTTILAALFYNGQMCAAHAGDSRMYRLRENELTRVTNDHSLVHEQVRRGLVSDADARRSRAKNMVTRALGMTPGTEPELSEHSVLSGDLYMLCSDGLTDLICDEVIQKTMTGYGTDLEGSTIRLISLANEAGGPDNISVILISARNTPKRGLFARLFGK
ncbi:MAG: Stp1/IreP family PP2C-type Ser/Thr phosphatase [Mariprofundus sp.]